MTDAAPKIGKLPPIDRYEATIIALVSRCHGDTHEAMRALLNANEMLEQELEAALAATSAGYRRRRRSTRGGNGVDTAETPNDG